MLTSAPCSTKNVTISIEFILMAILRGHSLIYRELHITMINMKRKRISFMLTSAPCSTKNWTISIELALMAILRGHSLISREFHKIMINMERKEML